MPMVSTVKKLLEQDDPLKQRMDRAKEVLDSAREHLKNIGDDPAPQLKARMKQLVAQAEKDYADIKLQYANKQATKVESLLEVFKWNPDWGQPNKPVLSPSDVTWLWEHCTIDKFLFMKYWSAMHSLDAKVLDEMYNALDDMSFTKYKKLKEKFSDFIDWIKSFVIIKE